MKIIFLSRRFYPDVGGVEKHVMELSKELIKKGHDITVVTESKGKFRNLDKISIVRLPKYPENWFKKFYIWKWMINHKNLFDEKDIVHAHDVYYWYFPLKILNPFKKSYVTFHGYETKFPPSKKAIFIRKISEKVSSGNICVGNYIKKWYGTNSDFVIEGAVNLGSKVNSDIKNKLVVFIGRLSKDMGISVYLKAYKKLKEMYPDFGIDFIKRGQDVDKLIAKSRFVFASGYLSIYEGLASGKIVFAVFDNPLKEDYLKDSQVSKYIIICGSEGELVSKVAFYIKNQDKEKEMIERSSRWIKTQTWDKIADKYLKLWEMS